jgi:ribosomal protein L23
VRTANYHGKKAVQMTKTGRHAGLRTSWKKAYVTLAEGQTIEAFDIA